MGKDAPDPPPPPNYGQIAQVQSEAEKQVAAQQNFANRPDIYTPWGRQTWAVGRGTDPSTGQPVSMWSQRTRLDPRLQQALDSQIAVQQGLSDIGQSFQGRVEQAYRRPFDWLRLPETGEIGDPSTAAAEAYERIDALRQPNVVERRARLETQLANQGITPGSAAFQTEMRRLGDEETRGELQAQLEADRFATSQQQRDIAAADYANQIRQQAIAEQRLRRSLPLNEMQAVLTGQQVGMPEMPSFQRAVGAQAPQILGAAGQQYNAALDAYNAEAGAYGNQIAGLYGLGSSAISAAVPFMLSDARVKEVVTRLGELASGIPVYVFRYLWSSVLHVGVLAQDVYMVKPEAVALRDDGLLAVNYGAL